MNKRILVGCLLAPVSLLCALPAAADPYFCAATGHYYEVVEHNGIDWESAVDAAAARTFAGGAGELATITSAEEDACVEAAWESGKPSRTEVWVGGFQPPGAKPASSHWAWVNGDTFGYTNWQSGEPNDQYGPASEQHLAVGLGNNYKWNDEGALGNIGGYIVEYETLVEIPGSECDPCVYNGIEYTVEIPPGVVNPTITFQSFALEDNEACGIEARDFILPTIGGVIETKMAKYLCGVKNPAGVRQFVAVVVSKSFESLQAADVLTDPSEYFENSLSCDNPILGGNPLEQDIAHFATDIIGDMPRSHSSDATYDCGSSRGKVKGTILFIGTQYVFKDGEVELDWTQTPDAVTLAFIGVTRDRLQDLIRAINDAKPGVPKKQLLRWLAMRVAAELALWSHDRGNYLIARKNVNAVNQLFAKASYSNKAGSAPAFIDIWGSHLMFMYNVKVIPYAP